MGMKWILYIYVCPKYQSKTNSKEIKKLFKKGEGGREWEKNKTRYPIGQHMLVKIRLHMLKRHHLKTFYFSSWFWKYMQNDNYKIKLKVPGNFKIFPLISAIQKVFFPTGFSNEWNWCDFSYSTFLTKKLSSIIADMNQKDSKIK